MVWCIYVPIIRVNYYDLFDFADELFEFVPVFRPSPKATCVLGNPLTNLLASGIVACFFEICSLALTKVSKILLDLFVFALFTDSENESCFDIDDAWLCGLGFGEGDFEDGGSIGNTLPDDDVLLSVIF